MITRSDYMAGKATHQEYYGDIVQSLPRLALPIRDEEIAAKLAEDEHLNNIPLKSWDILGTQQWVMISREVCKRTTGGCSLSDVVCVLKEAARQRAG